MRRGNRFDNSSQVAAIKRDSISLSGAVGERSSRGEGSLAH